MMQFTYLFERLAYTLDELLQVGLLLLCIYPLSEIERPQSFMQI